jgi:hypothetical protein
MVKEQDKDNAKRRENQVRAECVAQASKNRTILQREFIAVSV